MISENLLWGAPRIHGVLLKLGYDICENTIAKYMVQKLNLRHRIQAKKYQ